MRPRRPLLEVVPLLLLAFCPALPAPWGAVGTAGLLALFLLRRPQRREALAVALGGAVALLALAGDWALELRSAPARDVWRERAGESYRALWEELRRDARAAARDLGRPPLDAAARLTAFRRLGRLAEEGGEERRRTLLLVDPDGEPVVWGGEGLLKEFAPQDLPAAVGARALASLERATLFAVQPLGEEKRPWRVVAGTSLPTDRLPFAPPGRRPATAYRWSPAPPAAGAPAGLLRLEAPGAPPIWVQETGPFAWRAQPAASRAGARLAWGALALALVALAVLRTIGLAILAGTVLPASGGPGQVTLLAAAAALCGALALGSGAGTAGALALGVGVAAGALLRRPAAGDAPAPARGALAGLALLAVSLALQLWRGPLDLAAGLGGTAAAQALRLALCAGAAGLLVLAAGRRAHAAGADAGAWAAVVLLVATAGVHDRPLVAIPLLVAGAAAAASWTRASGLPRPAPIAVLAVLAALLAAGSWEIAYRIGLRRELGALLPQLRPPAAGETASLARELDIFFRGLDVARLVPGDPLHVDRRDLALAIWRASPLARANRLSAVVVVAGGGAVESSFAFGLPLTADGAVDRGPGRWQALALPAWDESLIAGEAPLVVGGSTLASVRYWLLPRPGFRLPEARPGDLEPGLLRGELGLRAIAGLPPPLRYGLYATGGRALRSPWKEAPPLPAALAAGGEGLVPVPGGRAWARAQRGGDGVAVLFLPLLDAVAAFDRVGTHAFAALLLVAAGAGLAVLLGLPRAAFRDLLRRAVRSYSKRLIIVFTALLLLPLLLLGVVLMRGIEERLLREQRTAGEAALNAAQRVLGEYLLTLEPGFGVDTALEDDLLVWLSRVVQHEVNLYWGSRLWASSKRELFTAGLLPVRIPGEIYARLALLEYDMAWRTNRAGGAPYLEIYAPLRVPGVPVERGESLALSMPLLAQQEETAAEIAALRRQVVLGAAALFALLVAVGTRLARNFTAPLTELVRGTQRIAAGASSVGFRPSELELLALVEAVDRMAARIGEARERLLREKQVVERMVENITAGVVSLDGERRVLMRNRVAAELLGVEVGAPIGAAAAAPGMEGLRGFLARAGSEPAHTALRVEVAGAGEREWTVVWVPVPGPGEPAALLVVEDSTEVLRAQRLQAWAEMARIIAHEIKNPLTPIRLSAEHMREVWASDRERFAPVFERCTANILRQVEDLREIAAEFSTYSSIPRIELRPGDLVTAVGEVVESYRAAPPAGVAVEFGADPAVIPARFDAKLLARAVRNLVENALRASARGGAVSVRVASAGGEARIVVADRGPGVAPELLTRIFDPYFSTHDTGTGLGLPIASRIAQEHGGAVTARNRAGGGLEVTIAFPLP